MFGLFLTFQIQWRSKFTKCEVSLAGFKVLAQSKAVILPPSVLGRRGNMRPGRGYLLGVLNLERLSKQLVHWRKVPPGSRLEWLLRGDH